MLESAEGEGQQSFWQQELGGDLPVLDLPADYPRPAVQSYRGASCFAATGSVLTSKLKSLAQLNDATLFMTLLAAFDVLLYRHTGQRELLVGSPASGRRSARLAHTVGYFVNPIVTRAQLSAECPSRSCWRRCGGECWQLLRIRTIRSTCSSNNCRASVIQRVHLSFR
jgi:hypothetical protein